MGFGEAVRTCLSKYATFSGRASRSEYWWFYLFCALLVGAAMVVDVLMLGYDPDVPTAVPWLTFLAILAIVLPSLAAAIRRLHDTDKSGWWYLISLVPFVGGIVLLIFLVIAGTDGDNRFGPKPAS